MITWKSVYEFFKLEGTTHYKHCERTAGLTYFGVGITLLLAMYTIQSGLMWAINGVSILSIFAGGTLLGILGIVYYKFKYKKWKL